MCRAVPAVSNGLPATHISPRHRWEPLRRPARQPRTLQPRICLILALALAVTTLAYPARALENEPVRILLKRGAETITLHATAPVQLGKEDRRIGLRPGTYRIAGAQTIPAVQQFHLFVKTFPMDQTEARDAYLASLRDAGFDPQVLTLGRTFTLDSGQTLDTRVQWVSIERAPDAEAAEARRKELERNGYSAWVQAETRAPGRGYIRILADDGAVLASFDTSITIRSAEPVSIDDVNAGFMDANPQTYGYSGVLHARVGPDAKLELLEVLPIEDYLRGVLPAEMHFSWPTEALKAQAVAARSDIIAGLGGRYTLEGFDFYGTERSRAYVGASGRQPATDDAVQQTAGEFLITGNRVAPTVFSANCGGWTENNDTVWYGPPDPALRGVADFPESATPDTSPANSPKDWLSSRPDAYCAHDETYYRWERSYSEPELRAIMAPQLGVGRIEDIELGERGVSGRLKWLRVHGSDGTETIHKELPIRRLFGGLPSALFTLDTTTDPDGTRRFVLHGGGRGHGVGMCQQGARGMAETGADYRQILQHYYTDVTLVR